MYVYIFVYIYISMYVCMHVCIHISMLVYICRYIYICMYKYICIHGEAEAREGEDEAQDGHDESQDSQDEAHRRLPAFFFVLRHLGGILLWSLVDVGDFGQRLWHTQAMLYIYVHIYTSIFSLRRSAR